MTDVAVLLPLPGGAQSGDYLQVLRPGTTPALYSSPVPASTSVAVRAPSASDDATQGYAVGDLWSNAANVWQCLQTATGNAMWSPVAGAAALPVDAVGGAVPVFVGGTRRFRSGYTGNLINVTRASDSTTLAIGQVGRGLLDEAALEAFGAGTTLTVNTVYDQSGSGFDATQATAANQPSILRRNQTGNSYSIVLDSRRQGTLTSKFLALSASSAGTTVAVSAFLVVRNAIAPSQTELLSLTGTAAARNWYFGYNGSGNQWRSAVTGSGLTPLNGKPQTTPQIIGVVSGASSHILYVDNTSASNGASIGSTAWNGGFIGQDGSDPTHTGYFETPFVAVWGRALSAAEQLRLAASLNFTLGLTPQMRDTISFYGDSITEGYGGSFLQSYPRQVGDFLGLPARLFDSGNFGQQITVISSQANMTTSLTPIAVSGRRNVLAIFGGTNDYNGSVTGAAVYAAYQLITTQAKAMGFTRVVWCTTLPRTSLTGALETERLAGNALIRANAATLADGLCDLANDATMGASGAAANTAIYLDGTHPTDLGYQYIAAMLAPVVGAAYRI